MKNELETITNEKNLKIKKMLFIKFITYFIS